jgi:tRNA (cytidine/uridine-2'-O-)-methyltransferase
VHRDFDAFRQTHPDARIRLLSAVAPRSYLEAAFAPGDALVFGSESSGLPDPLLEAFSDDCFAIPTIGAVRSLNLAHAVSIVLYEAYRQLGAFARVRLD